VSRTKLFGLIGLVALLPGLAFSAALGIDENSDEISASSAATEAVEMGSGSIEFAENQSEGAPVKCCWVFHHGQWYCIWC
jgi:hypothetical protein